MCVCVCACVRVCVQCGVYVLHSTHVLGKVVTHNDVMREDVLSSCSVACVLVCVCTCAHISLLVDT